METEKLKIKQRILRKKYSAEEKAKYCGEWQESGLSRNEFCRERRLPLATFCTWLTRAKRKVDSKFSFIPIKTKCEERTDAVIEIKWPNGLLCRFPDKLDTRQVSLLIKELHDITGY